MCPFQVVWAGLPGQEVGNALADVLYGAWNPSGRLPYTIAKSPSDYGAQLILPAAGQNPTGTDPLQIPYTEGLNIDYRHFDAVSASPLPSFLQKIILIFTHSKISLPDSNLGSG